MAAAKPETVVFIPEPVVVTLPGLRVKIHVPDAGKPLRTTLPVCKLQVGAVITPTVGAGGGLGTALITTLAEAVEVQPAAFVTVKVKVPVAKPETVVLIPEPVVVTLPGLRVKVHVPDAGKPLRRTLPVDKEQVGCVMVPTEGGIGVVGAALMTTGLLA